MTKSFAGRCGPEQNVQVRGECESNFRGCGAGAGTTCAGRGGADTEYKFMCGFSQARGPAGQVRAWLRGRRRSLSQIFEQIT